MRPYAPTTSALYSNLEVTSSADAKKLLLETAKVLFSPHSLHQLCRTSRGITDQLLVESMSIKKRYHSISCRLLPFISLGINTLQREGCLTTPSSLSFRKTMRAGYQCFPSSGSSSVHPHGIELKRIKLSEAARSKSQERWPILQNINPTT